MRIAGIYALCGLLWIALSDRVLALFLRDSDALTRFQTFKGWLFILATALLVYLLTRSALLKPARLEEKVRESEERYRLLVEAANSVILTWDTAGNITFLNDYGERFFGFRKSELIGRNMVGTIVPETESSGRDLARLMQEIQQDPDRFRDNENENMRKDGGRVWVRWANKAIPDREGALTGVLSVGYDVTERKRAEVTLRDSESRFRALFENLNVVALVVDPADGRILDANEAAAAFYGWTREQLRAMRVSQINTLSPDEIRARIDEAAGRRRGTFHFKHRLADGTVRDVEVHSGPIPFQGRTVLCSIIHDVTERKRAEEKISKYSHDLQRLLAVSREMTVTTDVAGLYRAAVQTAADLLRFDFSTVMVLSGDKAGLTIMDAIGFPPAMIGHFSLVEGQGLSTYVVKNKRPDAVFDFATEIRFEVPAVVREKGIRSALCVPMMLGEDVFGVLIGHTLEQRTFSIEDIAIYQNIGNAAAIAIRNALSREALRKSEENLRNITSNIAEGLYVLDAKGRITFMNAEAERLLGWSVEELNERGAHQLVHYLRADGTPLPPEACRMHGAIERRARYESNDEVFVRRDGTVFPISVVCNPVTEDSGEILSIVAFRDITETKRLEQELLKIQKLESVGTLAGGIAHDFNNLLQGVFGYISMAKRSLGDRDRAAAMLAQAEQALHQSVSLTTQLLTFSKGGAPVKKSLRLGPLIESSVRFALGGSHNTCRFDIPQDLSQAEADEGQLGQVLHNIVINADQAMPLGGRIDIEARNVPASSPELPPGLAPADYVRISIRDNGAGIPAEHLPRIFDPYFTTKEKGSGLGLATSFAIVRNHGGMITAESGPGKGSVFHIFLPASGLAPEPAARGSVQAPPRKGRVLVMDDEEIVRKVAGELLRELGQDVEVAEEGGEAIKKYRSALERGARFDIVILDLTIRGGMGGAETMKKLLAIDPSVTAVVSSGYSGDAKLANYQEHGFRAFLKKPYAIPDLQAVLNALLGADS